VLARPTLPDPGSRKLVFQCEAGIASEKAGEKMREAGWSGDVYHLPGGIRAWKRAGLPVEQAAWGGLSIPRQVQIGAGSIVVLSVILGATVSPRFFALAGFVGAGLVFAGATGTCGMAAVLARLPYNRRNLNV
jgi:hypothetical protein